MGIHKNTTHCHLAQDLFSNTKMMFHYTAPHFNNVHGSLPTNNSHTPTNEPSKDLDDIFEEYLDWFSTFLPENTLALSHNMNPHLMDQAESNAMRKTVDRKLKKIEASLPNDSPQTVNLSPQVKGTFYDWMFGTDPETPNANRSLHHTEGQLVPEIVVEEPMFQYDPISSVSRSLRSKNE